MFNWSELPLAKLYLIALHEGTHGVSFRSIHLKRPIIDEYWFCGLHPLPDNEECDFLQSFHYVAREDIDTSVTLADGDGEDIHKWPSMLADNYQLVDTEPSLMY